MPTDSSVLFNYEDLYRQLNDHGHGGWVNSLRSACSEALQSDRHGQLSTWLELLQQIRVPDRCSWHIDEGRVIVAAPTDQPLRELLRQFCPWRKGPLNIAGVNIDTEWRSDLKWDRVADHVEWRDRRVLDVGCGNGYFGWRMLDAGANCVVGLDPFLLFVMQHEIVKRLAGDPRNYVLPLTDACLVPRLGAFDIAVSMGVLYHRTSPIDHLQILRESLRDGGQLVLETLIVETGESTVLVPHGRYAKMRNVWFIPSPSMLTLWLKRTGFQDIRVVDITPTTSDEQRRTEWMTFESLNDYLDPNDSKKTMEGYPAPVRAVITARLL
ncbi:MAG: tRNA 5-methoxyuridine(34)/uridine 5-oxyacetic acid(34) synthase CmoB [Fuerstiella sp.]|nr:tRNA 5-methoxyuridine(34)/uridine 5-oxyacetic acid(34) synthase CmoB [Fuerstiella sp.]